MINYEQDMDIDETALDAEWLNQASLAMKYGKHWARCKEVLTRAEENIKVIRAQLVKEAYRSPDECLGKGNKPTGVNLEAYYRDHEDHIEAKDEWINAQYEFNMAEVAKWEISNTRRLALENLVRLHGQQYFAGPSVPHDLADIRELKEEKQNKLHSKIGKSLRTTKS